MGIIIDYKDVKEKLKIRVLEKRETKDTIQILKKLVDIQNLKKLIEWSENDK